MTRIACAAALVFAGWAASALAQSEPPLDERIRIEVTGSRIPRIEVETALPVQVITRDEILRGNWTTAGELLANLPANLNSATPASSIANFGNPGLESANLRGLGDGNTLVLLNGRRLANYAFLSGTVNLGSIPLAAIDRVEILKDGASSIYGTDAVAGVINFITRKDYTGMDVVGQAGITERGGGDRYQTTVSAGWGNLAADHVNGFVTLDWQKETALAARDRTFSATGYRPDQGYTNLSVNSFPANIRASTNTFLNPGYASGCDPPLSTPTTVLGSRNGEICAFDFAATANILPDTERLAILARGTWQVTPEHQLFAEYLFARTKMTLAFSPTPVDRDLEDNPIYYPADGPFYPTAYASANGLSGPLKLNYRTVSLGPRTDVVTTEAQRLVVGAQGDLGEWSYNLGYNHSQNTAEDDYTKGWVLASRIIPALGSGLVDPWGPDTQTGQDLLASTQFIGVARTAKGTLDQVDFSTTGAWLPLPGGPVALALGAEWRHEALADHPAAILDTGDVIGVIAEVNPQDASRTVGALFAELSLPLTKELEVLASVRYDQYSDFGGTTNPKLGIRWQPAKSLLLRGAWGTGFRAPTLVDLYTPQFTAGQENLSDPVRCPVTNTPEDCNGPFDVVSGGNPQLQPETSTQTTAGFIWEPAKGWSIGAQWWHIAKSNVISTLSADDVLGLYDSFGGSNVIRGPVDPAYPGLPGPIAKILTYNQNLGSLKTSGIDFALRAQSPPSSLGQLSFSFAGTYVYQFLETLPGTDPYSYVGQMGFYGSVPRWRHYAELYWQQGPWGATLSESYQSGVLDSAVKIDGEPRQLGAYSLWNLQGTYTALRNTTIAVGVRNLFDTAPPFTGAFQFGFDPAYADVHGRTFYARASYSFR
ncbi:MAG TPA: TonB-dependent receptor [Casimicrobiaceae bacterium]|nr:TonB-dependent receptor [Casimicrobiaceae bacterium]